MAASIDECDKEDAHFLDTLQTEARLTVIQDLKPKEDTLKEAENKMYKEILSKNLERASEDLHQQNSERGSKESFLEGLVKTETLMAEGGNKNFILEEVSLQDSEQKPNENLKEVSLQDSEQNLNEREDKPEDLDHHEFESKECQERFLIHLVKIETLLTEEGLMANENFNFKECSLQVSEQKQSERENFKENSLLGSEQKQSERQNLKKVSLRDSEQNQSLPKDLDYTPTDFKQQHFGTKQCQERFLKDLTKIETLLAEGSVMANKIVSPTKVFLKDSEQKPSDRDNLKELSLQEERENQDSEQNPRETEHLNEIALQDSEEKQSETENFKEMSDLQSEREMCQEDSKQKNFERKQHQECFLKDLEKSASDSEHKLKFGSLKRFLRIPRKTSFETVESKDDNDIGLQRLANANEDETAVAGTSTKSEAKNDFKFRLEGLFRHSQSSESESKFDLNSIASKTTLKSSVSNYWNSLFKKKPKSVSDVESNDEITTTNFQEFLCQEQKKQHDDMSELTDEFEALKITEDLAGN